MQIPILIERGPYVLVCCSHAVLFVNSSFPSLMEERGELCSGSSTTPTLHLGGENCGTGSPIPSQTSGGQALSCTSFLAPSQLVGRGPGMEQCGPVYTV